MKPSRAAKYYYLKFLRLQGDPHSLALGVSIGLFVGTTPTLPLHTALIIILAWPLRGNILAALIAATAISNPLTWLPQYYFSWRLGSWLLPGLLSWERIQTLLALFTSGAGFRQTLSLLKQLGLEATAVMLLGGVLMAIPVACGGYILSFKFFSTLRKKRLEKHILT
ncbi:DUF2062 domain-containing protein [Thiovibrio frasassiensis]|uniref:DUF2062 domain-containing protein n=1 Tax=Thiovibrio frasassiensis TaxID=2984131 RepID=A0A9X4MHX7_9BACT|nr:DUF2062 domain-containing protein [Thiovibrio frasassiensis]MDG4476550.1 DUF2062 domain-containing protein [Thiovibrio frasassiensis]